jgi:site-specific recombinase XerD
MLSQQVTTVTPEVIDRFRSSLFVKGKMENTVKAYSTDMRVFLTQACPEMSVSREEFEELGATWLTMNRRKVSAKTTGRRLTSLRAFARWAGWGLVLEDYSAPDPGKQMPHPIPEGMDGVYRLIDAAKLEKHQVLIVLCGMCGCRVSEALSIRPSDIDIPNMVLTIRGKGDKTRFVPISETAWLIIQNSIVRRMIEGSDEVLVPMYERHARKVITELGVRAQLSRHISSHDLRATFATAVFDKTGNVRIVQDLLGHSSSTQTEVYIGVKFAEMREAVQL